jgi:DNA mismatch repair protein MutS
MDNETEYVPNDVDLDEKTEGILLYGINGSGKSCYSKAIGLAIVLAQSGHFVPADYMEIAPFKRLYTRTTCDDNIFKGHSSFIVEMVELKSIITYADENSIVIGDEVCKGTEEVSALSIVGTTIRWLLDRKCKFVFATHLHKLPTLSILKDETRLGIKHISIEMKDHKDLIVFTRKLLKGQGERNYGIEIANKIVKNDDFFVIAKMMRSEVEQRSKFLVSTKKSRYNSDVLMDKCQICGCKEGLEGHHIVFQKDAPQKRRAKENLVVLCEVHHNEVHSGKINVSGWKKTTTGKMLDYSIN